MAERRGGPVSAARALLLGLGLLTASALGAHDGVDHGDEATPSAPVPGALARPQWQADGELQVSKPLQHLLGIRTRLWTGEPVAESRRWLAEVEAQPLAAVTLAAPEAGRLEAAEGGWPLPGQRVAAGQVLAWLRPQASPRDAAQRQALLADLAQKLVIADINVERLSLQAGIHEGGQASGNVYYEQALAEREAMRHQQQLLQRSLGERLPIRAGSAGRLAAATARAGDVVAAGALLFRLSDTLRLRLSSRQFDPGAGARLQSAVAKTGDAEQPLRYRGQEPAADGRGWQLWFDLPEATGAAPLWPGQPVEVEVRLRPRAAPWPAGACVEKGEGLAQVWTHPSPERFRVLKLKSCTEWPALAAGERLVTEGARLLASY